MKKITVLIMLFVLIVSLSYEISAKDGQNYYQTVINKKELADPVVEKMRGYLYYNLGGMAVGYPYVVDLVSPQDLDKMAPSTYKGMEVGLYNFEKTFHHIYMINNLAVDDFLGTVAHEFAHAWQTENCPPNQNIVIKEGFADWVAYKVLQMDGAINASNNIFYRADPVYGKGFKIILQVEDQRGVAGVLEYVKKTVNGE